MEFAEFFGTLAGLTTIFIVSAVVAAVKESDKREKKHDRKN